MSFSHGFPPVAAPDARVLILGALPGAQSLAQRRYYAHPQNSFWRIMGVLAGADPDLAYDERLARLSAHRIALWDVCKSAMREGSLDSAIKSPESNDFGSFLQRHPQIQRICFNGERPAQLFKRLVSPGLVTAGGIVDYLTLPSTSSAYASIRFEEKLARWRHALAGGMEEHSNFAEGPAP